MTTPRDLHVQNNTILPPFVELDMMQEGFGCLYLPSLSPTSPHAASGKYFIHRESLDLNLQFESHFEFVGSFVQTAMMI